MNRQDLTVFISRRMPERNWKPPSKAPRSSAPSRGTTRGRAATVVQIGRQRRAQQARDVLAAIVVRAPATGHAAQARYILATIVVRAAATRHAAQAGNVLVTVVVRRAAQAGAVGSAAAARTLPAARPRIIGESDAPVEHCQDCRKTSQAHGCSLLNSGQRISQPPPSAL